MTINCWSKCKVTQPGLNKVRFPDQIIMLLGLSLFYEAAWGIDWKYCVWSCSFAYIFFLLWSCNIAGPVRIAHEKIKMFSVVALIIWDLS